MVTKSKMGIWEAASPGVEYRIPTLKPQWQWGRKIWTGTVLRKTVWDF